MKAKAFGVFVLAALSALAGFWGGREVERRKAEEESRKAAEAHLLEVESLRSEALAWADEIARRQGEAIVRTFVAGVAPSILAGRGESLELSALSLLRLDGVVGLHVVAADGRVLYSSDAKVTTTGDAGEAGRWAIDLREPGRRAGSRPGTFEVAVPVVDGGRAVAAVWIEYDQASVREAARPEAAEALGTGAGAPAEEPAGTDRDDPPSESPEASEASASGEGSV